MRADRHHIEMTGVIEYEAITKNLKIPNLFVSDPAVHPLPAFDLLDTCYGMQAIPPQNS